MSPIFKPDGEIYCWIGVDSGLLSIKFNHGSAKGNTVSLDEKNYTRFNTNTNLITTGTREMNAFIWGIIIGWFSHAIWIFMLRPIIRKARNHE